MRVFLAGASGAVGKRLIPLLIGRGHSVTGTTKSPAKAEELRRAGAEPVILDALDREAVIRGVVAARPDVVVEQLTALAHMRNLRRFDKEFAMTNRLRTEGTEHLLAGAREAGTPRFVAQSYTGWPNARGGARVKTEQDPLETNPPKAMVQTLAAIQTLESAVTHSPGITGIVLRYGSFYGPGTAIAPGGGLLEAVRKRQVPIIGEGRGVWSFIHMDDVAEATVLAVENGPGGIYNIVDDEPAEISVWLPELAQAIGAAAPRRIPTWLGRLIAGEVLVSMMTEIRGSSNAKAKELLHWTPGYASWRVGFRKGLQAAPA